MPIQEAAVLVAIRALARHVLGRELRLALRASHVHRLEYLV